MWRIYRSDGGPYGTEYPLTEVLRFNRPGAARVPPGGRPETPDRPPPAAQGRFCSAQMIFPVSV
ncbi:hypothetical protein GCM10018781_47200 [Kitasatospora indigofera]|uniref:Uncharacterized protein n=1 Tax=Kitasatospora indigofera TaxID=67307 RepID=A0A919KXD8_9ACTN|nr:hypothetical protein GCM10018781_47200 [Kitasatospora indigofera]